MKSIANRIPPLCFAGLLAATWPSASFGSNTDPSAPAPSQAPADTKSGQATYTELGYGSYPRVTELEQQFLGKTYVNEALPSRVSRLEVKKFGKTSSGDLCDRIDKLDQYAQPKPPPPESDVSDDDGGQPLNRNAGAGNYQAMAPSMPPASADNGNSQGQYSPADYGNYPKVTELEQEFLGKTFTVDALPVRIARLETKEFGKTFADEALCDRLDRLETKSTKPKQVADDDNNGNGNRSGSGSGSGKSSMGGTIGKAVMSLLGGGLGGGGVGVGGSPMMGGLPFGMGMGGMGMGGMGMGGMGMGGGRSGRYSQGNQNAPALPPPPQNPFLPGSEHVEGVEARTAVMEKFVFGRTGGHTPIEERVQRLEKKLVPYEHHDNSQDLARRVDHLWTILEAANKQPGKRDVAANDATLR